MEIGARLRAKRAEKARVEGPTNRTMAQIGLYTHRGMAGFAWPTGPGVVICALLYLVLVETPKEGAWRAYGMAATAELRL